MADSKVTQEIELKVKSGNAVQEIKDLQKALKELTKGLNGQVDLSLDTKDIDKSIGRIRKQLDNLSATVSTNIDDKDTLEKIDNVRKALNALKPQTVNVGVGNTQKAEGILSRIASTIRDIGRRTDINVGSGSLVDADSRASKLSNTLKGLGKTQNISTKLDDGGSLSTLTKIRDTILDIKKNSNINIKTTANTVTSNQVTGSDRITRHRSRKPHEVGDLLRTDQEQRVAPGYARSSANAIYSIGRASKGFGSALEVAAYQLGELAKNSGMSGAAGAVGTLAARVLPGIAVVTGLFAGFTTLIGVTKTLGSALMQVAEFIYKVLEPGIELYVSKTKATYGMAAAIKSQGYIGGQKFEEAYGKDSTNTSIALSTKLLNKAMLDAEKSVFDFSEIIESLQGTLPMLMSRGMSLDQAYEVNKGVAAVAKTLQLAPNQVLQEMRDIAQNSITSRSSQVANALHITNEDLKKFGDDVDKRFDYLMEKFANYREMLEEYSTTPVGAFERMKDRLLKVSSDIVEKMAPMFMGLFNMITDTTGHWEDENKNIFDTIDNTWKQAGQTYGIDKQGNKVEGGLKTNDEVGEAQFIPSEIIDKLEKSLPEIIKMVGELIDGFVDFIETLTDTDDPIDAIISLLKDAINIFFDLARVAAWAGDIIVDSFKLMEVPIVWVIRQLQLMAARFKSLTAMVKTFGASVAYALLSAVDKLPDGVKEFFGINGDGVHSAMEGARDYLGEKIDETKNALEWESKVSRKAQGIDGGFSFEDYMNERYGAGSKFGAISQALEKGTKAMEDMLRRQREGVQNEDLKSVKGNPNPASDDKNAQKKALQESQQAMKAHIEGLKDALKEHVDKIKDTLEKNKIAFDEGFMSLKDYFTQKAALEAEEAQARLAEAQEELAIIQKTQFANDYERAKATHDAERQIREYTRKVGDATQAIKEVSENWNNAMASLGDFTNAMYANRSAASGPNSPFVNSAGMSNEEIAYRFLVSQGFEDAIARGIVAAMKGESLGNPQDEHEDSNGLLSMGIAQWNGQRRDALLAFGQSNNSDPYNIMTQLPFLVQELNTTEKEALNKAIAYYNENGKTAEAMAYGFTKFVERPRDTEGEATRRMDFVSTVNALLQAANNRPSATGQQTDVTGAIQSALDGGYLGATLDNIDRACVEAVTKIGSYFSDTLKEAVERKIVNTDILDDFLEGKGIGKEDFNANTLQPGDIIFFDSKREKNAHVMMYKGNGMLTGNSTGQEKVIEQDLDSYLKYAKLTPTFVRKTGMASGFVPGGSYQSRANKTATGSEANKKFEEMLSESMQRAVDAQNQILDVFNPNYKAGISAKTNQIAEKYRKAAQKVTMQIPEGSERDQQLQNLVVAMNGELNDLESQVLEKRLEYNVNAAKTWGKYAGYEAFRGNAGSMAPQEFIKKYIGYFYDDINNPIAPAYVINKLWEKVKDYEKIGSVDKASATRQKILDTYNALTSMFDEYLTNLSNYMSGYRKWAESTDMTKQQKEQANQEIDAAENRLKAQFLGEQIEKNNEVLKKYQEEIIRVNNELARYIQLEREASRAGNKEKEESARQNVAYYKSESDRLKLSRQQLAIRTDQLKQEEIVAKNMAQNNDLMKQAKSVAKQALHDGLVKFLTDGVNEAKSLGESLRDLFTGILKEMQQFFAKQLANSIMNSLFPQMRPENGWDNFGRPNDPYSAATNYPGVGQRGEFQPTNPYLFKQMFPTPGMTTSTRAWENPGAFSVNNPMNKIDYVSQAKNSLNSFGANLETATQTVGNFDLGTQGATEALTSMSESGAKEGIAQEAVAQINTIGTNIGTAIQTAGNAVSTALNTVAMQISAQSIGAGAGRATGGLVTGAGTGTSDSIPTMLSNGEYVIKASSVRKLGTNFLNAINSGGMTKIRARLPHFAEGGYVGDIQKDTARGMQSFANTIGTSVSTTNNMNIALVRDEDEAMSHFMRSPNGQKIMLDFNRKTAHLTSQF